MFPKTFGFSKWEIMGAWVGVSGASTHIKREEVGAPPWLAAPPPWAASHSPIKGGWGLSLLYILVLPPFSPPAAPFHGRSLGEALSVGLFTTPRHRAAGVPRILYFLCPAGSRERESSSSWTCDRSPRHRRIAVHIFFVLRLVWVRLCQQRDLFS